jgi:glutamyl-tRNA reductase
MIAAALRTRPGEREAAAGAIQVAGISHKHVGIACREGLARDPDSTGHLLHRAAASLCGRECVVLSTCNRVEVYFVAPPESSPRETAARLFREMVGAGDGLDPEAIYHCAGEAAVRHLLEVTSGLDSMVVGESEILGQVKAAMAGALETGQAGPVLARLFQHAVKTGKRARRETAISSGIFSVGQCAARLAQQTFGELHGKRILVFGAGQIAKATAKHLAASRAGDITVFSRTPARARELAQSLGGTVVTSEELPAAFSSSDIVIGCAAAPHHLIRVPDVRAAMHDRGDRPMLIVDLGVPRNVDPAVGSLPGISLFNIDDLEAVVGENAQARGEEISRVREIVEEEVVEFGASELHQKMTRLIVQLRTQAEQLRQECLSQVVRGSAPGVDSEALDYATDLLVRKLLHQPIVTLREAARGQERGDVDLIAAVARIFGLPASDEPVESDRDSRAAESKAAARAR